MPHTDPHFMTAEENLHYQGVLDIDPKELIQKQHHVLLIDVRQPNEFTGELGHIPGSKLIVLDELAEKFSTLPREKPIVLICRSGARSARAASFLKENGFQHVYNLKGGMLLWNELHYPTEG
jgi:hydroxyacylglutathione hydrolase